MKAGRYFALIMGVLFLAIGIMGFVPALVKTPMSHAEMVNTYDSGFGYLMGLFPINSLHNGVHLTVGILGIFASLSLAGARIYGRALFAFYGLLALMGLIPYADTTFGLIPIYGNDVWLHAVTAGISFYFGFIDSPGLLELSSEKQKGYRADYGPIPEQS